MLLLHIEAEWARWSGRQIVAGINEVGGDPSDKGIGRRYWDGRVNTQMACGSHRPYRSVSGQRYSIAVLGKSSRDVYIFKEGGRLYHSVECRRSAAAWPQ